MAATGIAELIPRHPALGGALFAGATAATIELRRFGPRIAAAGTVTALPLVASLVLPTGDGAAPSLSHTLWLGLDALIVGAYTDLDDALGRLAAIYASPPGNPPGNPPGIAPIEPPATPNATSDFRQQ